MTGARIAGNMSLQLHDTAERAYGPADSRVMRGRGAACPVSVGEPTELRNRMSYLLTYGSVGRVSGNGYLYPENLTKQ
jgi:hypothetical protein